MSILNWLFKSVSKSKDLTDYKVSVEQTQTESLIREELKVREAAYGLDHPIVAEKLGELGLLLKASGRFAESEPLIRRALKILEDHCPDSLDLATGLNNLASLLQETNRFSEAELLYRRALEINEKLFGLDHPNVAVFLSNLASL
jgi:tetratricopeptide (TPR) repeat protein